jgi:hypothetical protein
MTDQTSTLYAKLLGETAIIEWKALERFWAKGDLIWVDPSLDLIVVAEAMAENRSEIFAKWRSDGTVGPVSASRRWTCKAAIQRSGRWWFRRSS